MDGRGFESHPRQLIFLRKIATLGELCSVALFFCCVVVPLSKLLMDDCSHADSSMCIISCSMSPFPFSLPSVVKRTMHSLTG